MSRAGPRRGEWWLGPPWWLRLLGQRSSDEEVATCRCWIGTGQTAPSLKFRRRNGVVLVSLVVTDLYGAARSRISVPVTLVLEWSPAVLTASPETAPAASAKNDVASAGCGAMTFLASLILRRAVTAPASDRFDVRPRVAVPGPGSGEVGRGVRADAELNHHSGQEDGGDFRGSESELSGRVGAVATESVLSLRWLVR